MSSITNTTGRRAHKPANCVSTSSNSRARAVSLSTCTSPGSSFAGVSACPRSAAVNGANGRPPPLRSTQPPYSTSASTSAVKCLTSRVLPIPASPPISTVAGEPPRTSAHDSPSTAISAARPTSTGLTATTP